MNKIEAIKESIADTMVAMVINVPLNFFLVSIAYYYEWSAIATTTMLTAVFTIIAIIRKTYIRLHFAKKYQPTRQNIPKYQK